METSTCRLPGKLSDRLDQAAEERGAFESEIVRRAIRFYIEQNPDGIRAFTAGSAGRQASTPTGGNGGREAVGDDRGEVEEARVDVAEAVESEPVDETGDTASSTVYDPVEDC